jgi:hypothetical protein
MDYKVKLIKCQNEHHHGGYLTCGPSGPRGRLTGPTPWPTGHGLSQLGPGLDWHISTSVHKEGSEA